jgi:hypothetical protein
VNRWVSTCRLMIRSPPLNKEGRSVVRSEMIICNNMIIRAYQSMTSFGTCFYVDQRDHRSVTMVVYIMLHGCGQPTLGIGHVCHSCQTCGQQHVT